jgi:hypothetical protein
LTAVWAKKNIFASSQFLAVHTELIHGVANLVGDAIMSHPYSRFRRHAVTAFESHQKPGMPPMQNKFAKQLPLELEWRRRLYLLDTEPQHSLQVLNVQQYLPKEIHCYNSFPSQEQYNETSVRLPPHFGTRDLAFFRLSPFFKLTSLSHNF